MIKDIQSKIKKLKEEKDFCILAHSYMAQEIKEIADFKGDSYALAVKSKDVPQKNVIMCGVRFMAETVKILAPEKNVYLANSVAGCPMAEQMDRDVISIVKEQYPDYAVVAYINTTASLKTICDVCVTSSSAVKICKKMDADKILFIPDCNLGAYVAKQVPEKEFKLLNGGCPTHAKIAEKKLLEAIEAHPDAKVLVHPECQPDVVKHADYVGSTSGIMNFAKESSDKEFIIGTEIAIAEELQYACPDKKFYPMSKELICSNMKSTTLMDVYHCLNGECGEEIHLDEEERVKAKHCIDEMIRLG
ncbi:MAG: quinolinate synthase NadA [Ruminococcus sp.]|nr:quinolinate synthase NadA [Ruminococcus sp.]